MPFFLSFIVCPRIFRKSYIVLAVTAKSVIKMHNQDSKRKSNSLKSCFKLIVLFETIENVSEPQNVLAVN